MVDDTVGARLPMRCAMAKAWTMRDVSCTCRFAPLCPGFGGSGRAFSSSEKKPPAGLKEGSWKKSNRARALSKSHSRWAASVVKRGVPAAGSSFNADKLAGLLIAEHYSADFVPGGKMSAGIGLGLRLSPIRPSRRDRSREGPQPPSRAEPAALSQS